MSKYEKDKLITSLDGFANQNLVLDTRTNKVYHNGWCQSWQFRYIKIGVNNGWFYTVKEKEQNNDNCEDIN